MGIAHTISRIHKAQNFSQKSLEASIFFFFYNGSDEQERFLGCVDGAGRGAEPNSRGCGGAGAGPVLGRHSLHPNLLCLPCGLGFWPLLLGNLPRCLIKFPTLSIFIFVSVLMPIIMGNWEYFSLFCVWCNV